MFIYPGKIVRESLEKVCQDFEMTKSLLIKKIVFNPEKEHYLITLNNNSQRIVDQELLNSYIESAGLKNSRQIAAALLHSIDLEQSVPQDYASNRGDDFWDGEVQDALDYLEEKNKGKDQVEYDF
ncbi:MAG: hypothetical protein PHV17_05680 [Candidatus Omnitrophica bacterium]|nr:hypothetical protein [Candidatus Omnitrophota bacterium]